MFWLYGTNEPKRFSLSLLLSSFSQILFLSGGTLIYGSNSLAAYDGTNFAANQDVILVAPNYRLNVFGFSNSPQIPLTQRNVG
jgi:carboxylesterase type B